MVLKDDVQALEEELGEGGFRKERRNKRPKEEKEPAKAKKKKSKRIPNIATEAVEMKTDKETPEAKREAARTSHGPSPFILALQAARTITSRNPRQDQPEELTKLEEQLKKLEEGQVRKIVFRIQKEVLEEETKIQALFTVCRHARMIGVAYNTSTLMRAIREGDLLFQDLQDAGLAELKKDEKTKNVYTFYHAGSEKLRAGAEFLRQHGKVAAADIIAEHLRRSGRERAKAVAMRSGSAKTGQS
ncbi:MAG: hypothetical protein WC919_06190 [Candidatus Paceibacterota bacterium]|jgi:hypothetical protein